VHNYYAYIAGGAVDIVMPDVKYCGGMLELKKISAMAEGAGLPSSPHGPASPVGNMAAAQVCATLPNFLILELGFGEVPWRADLIQPAEVFSPGGLLPVGDQPGLGISINDRVAAQHKV
jgi:galactonate dehydratase